MDKPLLKRFFLIITFALCFILNAKIYVSADSPKKVLVLDSYSEDFKWTGNISKGINSVLDNDSEKVDLSYVYMDMKKIKDKSYVNALYNLHKIKYNNVKFDAIICSDNDALDYLVNYGDTLFPNTPVVFCGINNFDESILNGHKNYTGIVETIVIEQSIKTILKLQPYVNNIILVCDSTSTGALNEERAREITKTLKWPVNFNFYIDTNIENLKDVVTHLGKNTAILHIGQLKDNEGNFINYEKIGSSLFKNINVANYICWDFPIGQGIIGGKVINSFDQGKTAAQMTLRILNGEKINAIPIIKESPSIYTFDYNELVRFKIDKKNIPEESIIINKPFSFYEKYKNLVLTTVGIMSTLLIFIIILAVNINKRRISEKKLLENYSELTAVYEELTATEEELRAQYDELQQGEEFLRISEERHKLALEGSSDAIWEWDIEKNKFYASDKWEDITGYNFNEDGSLKNILEDLLSYEDKELIIKNLLFHLNGTTPFYNCEFKTVDKYGNERWLSIRGKALKNKDGIAFKMAGSITNVTLRKTIEEKNKSLAYYDSLTSLPNRTLLMYKLNEALNAASDNGEKGAVFFVDLDNFKRVNDTLGHDYGDKLLQSLAIAINDVIGTNATVYRLGGDEFSILIRDVEHKENIIKTCKDIINICKNPFEIDGKQTFTSLSIGVSLYPDDGIDSSLLLKNADTAMYKAKDLGKNRYEFFNKNMFNEVLKKSKIEKGLRNALENNEFQLYYQPQIDCKTKKIQGMEALLRWKNNDFGFVCPADFIPVAEETSLILPIGEWVVKTACIQGKEWLDKGYNLGVMAVNVSIVQLQHTDFLNTVKTALKESKLPPELLEIEITESVLMECVDYNIETLHKLRQLGINIALDDFGTGYSSLSYLRILPINNLKIDKSFIDSIHLNYTNRSVVYGIIELAHKMNLNIVAEGVEWQDQFDILQSMNCERVQGYFFSKPIPADNIEDLTNLMTHKNN
jgi:PAS domain S-box/diguanylate cyclase (GGDEF) domain